MGDTVAPQYLAVIAVHAFPLFNLPSELYQLIFSVPWMVIATFIIPYVASFTGITIVFSEIVTLLAFPYNFPPITISLLPVTENFLTIVFSS